MEASDVEDLWGYRTRIKDGLKSRIKNTKASNVSVHFVDKLIDKMVKSGVEDVTSKKEIEKKLSDPDRRKKQSLSVRTLTSNFKKLAGKLGIFFNVHYGLIHIFTWRRPAKTISFLIFYTTICIWPHLGIAYPLIFFLFGVVIPNYYYRHPMSLPEIIKVKKRGQSLFSWLFDSKETSIIHDYIDETDTIDVEIDIIQSTETGDIFTQHQIKVDDPTFDLAGNPKDPASLTSTAIKNQVNLLMNMRDLQNLTTDLLKGIEVAENSWFDSVGFKDEKLSTVVFYAIIFIIIVIIFLGQYIPWRSIFVSSGWILLVLCHPSAKKYLKSLSKAKSSKPLKVPLNDEQNNLEPQESETKTNLNFSQEHIIVDDSPEIKIVEVWELQTKSLLKLDWSFYCYTNSRFSKRDAKRITGNRPEGVDTLSKIQPPVGWKFDFGFANKWEIDYQPDILLKERYQNDPTLTLKKNETEGWIYDSATDIDNQEINIEFRRRRLFRECFRYARSSK